MHDFLVWSPMCNIIFSKNALCLRVSISSIDCSRCIHFDDFRCVSWLILYVLPNPLCKFWTKVGNIGDSRVLLGRADGTIVEGKQISMQGSNAFTSHPSIFLWLSPVTSHEGPGTDGGLTTDHKPDHPVGHKVGIGLIIQAWSGMQHSMACKRSYSSPSIAFICFYGARAYLSYIYLNLYWDI